MTLKKLALSLALQFVLVGAAVADCALPKPPGAVPNGSSASAADMDNAKAGLEKYQKATKDYLACIDAENKARIATLGDKVDMIRQVKLMAEKRSASIQEALQTYSDELNDQLRVFKLTNRQ